MNNDVMKILTDQGLDKKNSSEILGYLKSYEEKRAEWKDRLKVTVTSIEQVEEMEQAREFRLATVKDRTSAEKFIDSKRKEGQEEMSVYLKKDKALLKIKQFYEKEAKEVEASLKLAEEFKERHEAEQKKILHDERFETLSAYYDTPDDYPLDSMTEKSFNDLVEALKVSKEKKEKEQKLQDERYEKVKEVLSFFDDSLLTTLGELSEEDFEKKLKEAIKDKKADEKAKEDAQKAKEKTFVQRVEELKNYDSKFQSMIGMNTTEEIYQSILAKAKAYVAPTPKVSTPIPTAPAPMAKVVSKTSAAIGADVSAKSDRQKLEIFLESFTYSPIVPVTDEGKAVYKDLAVKFKGYLKWANGEIGKLK